MKIQLPGFSKRKFFVFVLALFGLCMIISYSYSINCDYCIEEDCTNALMNCSDVGSADCGFKYVHCATVCCGDSGSSGCSDTSYSGDTYYYYYRTGGTYCNGFWRCSGSSSEKCPGDVVDSVDFDCVVVTTIYAMQAEAWICGD